MVRRVLGMEGEDLGGARHRPLQGGLDQVARLPSPVDRVDLVQVDLEDRDMVKLRTLRLQSISRNYPLA